MTPQAFDTAWRNDPSVAARYANAENATRPFAKRLVAKSGIAAAAAAAAPIRALDLATGTGALVAELYAAVPQEHWGSMSVLCGDVSASMLAYVQERGQGAGWAGLETGIVDGNDIRLERETYTHAFCTFGVFGMSACVPALRAVLKPGGFVGVTTWRRMAWYPLLRRSIALMPSSPPNPSEHDVVAKMYAGCAWDSPSYVASRLTEAGFVNVETLTEKIVAMVGTPDAFMETMSFPLKMLVQPFWPADTSEALMKELEGVMRGEVVKMAGSEDGIVEMEFEAVLAWGWRA